MVEWHEVPRGGVGRRVLLSLVVFMRIIWTPHEDVYIARNTTKNKFKTATAERALTKVGGDNLHRER